MSRRSLTVTLALSTAAAAALFAASAGAQEPAPAAAPAPGPVPTSAPPIEPAPPSNAPPAPAPAAAPASGSSPAPAGGPGFGARATSVLVIDNLLGLHHTSFGSGSSSDSDDGITQVGTPLNVFFIAPSTRFGAHFFVTENLSLGAGVHWGTSGSTSDRASGSDEADTSVFGIAPRIGFAHAFDARNAIWIRAGAAYYRFGFAGDRTEKDFSVGGELFYVYTPVSHFGITFGPSLDVTVSGKMTSSSPFNTGERDMRRRSYGLTMGFLFDL